MEGKKEEEEIERNSKIPTFPGIREWLPKSFFLSHPYGQTAEKATSHVS